MKKFGASVILVITSFIFVYSQNRLLTIDEATVGQYRQFVPQMFRQLSWRSGGETYTFVNKGELIELKLAKGFLILEHNQNFPVSCTLVTSKSSSILRKSLHNFFETFLSQYSAHFDNFTKVDQFQSADQLIHQFFPYIPDSK